VNLAGIGDRSPAELSGGMHRRVALARATILQLDFLIYDEPTKGLEPQTSEEINDLIISMAKNLNITSIVVTHDIHSVLEIADTVAFLEDQSLCWYGSIEKMRQSDNKKLMNFITASEYQIRS